MCNLRYNDSIHAYVPWRKLKHNRGNARLSVRTIFRRECRYAATQSGRYLPLEFCIFYIYLLISDQSRTEFHQSRLKFCAASNGAIFSFSKSIDQIIIADYREKSIIMINTDQTIQTRLVRFGTWGLVDQYDFIEKYWTNREISIDRWNIDFLITNHDQLHIFRWKRWFRINLACRI